MEFGIGEKIRLVKEAMLTSLARQLLTPIVRQGACSAMPNRI